MRKKACTKSPTKMYKTDPNQLGFKNFIIPFGGKLKKSNRWVKLSELIPWDDIEQIYSKNFSKSQGAPSKSARLAFGSLLIKEKLGLSDEETVEQIIENPYLQYFLGFEEFQEEPPFDASMMVHFRKRFKGVEINNINELIVSKHKREKSESEKDDSDGETGGNSGKLIIDATVCPSEITFPTDLKLLNHARELTETIIDILYKKVSAKLDKKPRTYRKVARRSYLLVARSKRVAAAKRRKSLRLELNCVERNLKSIDLLLSKGASLAELGDTLYGKLFVVSEVLRQQKQMYQSRVYKIEDRIVSISQPHIRPIKRGKMGKQTEFGAKISASSDGEFTFLDNLSWDNFNESQDLKKQVESFKERTGAYPESLHADKIYRTRENRSWCKELGIRLSGPALGRPKQMSKEEKVQAGADESVRNRIEGKFGQGKRRFGLGSIATKLANTSFVSIAMSFVVMNLEKILNNILFYFFVVLTICKRIFQEELLSNSEFRARA